MDTSLIFQTFTFAFNSIRKEYVKRFGSLDLLLVDQDTAYQRTFAKHLAKNNIATFSDRSANKISLIERMGGLFKRQLALLAKKLDQPWYKLVEEAARQWNEQYISVYNIGPPEKYSEDNFDEVEKAVYDSEPMMYHSLYSMGHGITDKQAKDIFKYDLGDRVLVSLKTISKKIRNPVMSFKI